MQSEVIIKGKSEAFAEIVIRDLQFFSGFKRIEVEDTDGETIALKPTFNGGEVKKQYIPETWEELKELCKNICEFRQGAEHEFILVKVQDDCFWFSNIGTVEFPGLHYTFLKDLTPPLMWNFIRCLLKIRYNENN